MLHPPHKKDINETIVFRNDDVSYDTNLANFICFNRIFHRFGYVQLHGVTLWGKCNDTLIKNGIPCMYDSIEPDEIYEYEKCVKVSVDYVGNNEALIDYLNSIPDPIALHGLYHSDYSTMTYEQQDHDIAEGLKCLKELFPNKQIDTFVAPFNHTNENTYKVCSKYGLRVSAFEGEHLEDRIANGKGPLYEGELYRYHHHRFYPESTYFYYDLSLEVLQEYMKKYAYTVVDKMGRVLPSLGMIEACAKENNINKVGLEKTIVHVIEAYMNEYLDVNDRILQMDCGIGILLHRLWAFGYSNLYGNEHDERYFHTAKRIIQMIGSNIIIMGQNISELLEQQKMKAVVYINDSNVNRLRTYDVFNISASILEDVGYVILGNPKESEYELIDMASKFNAMLVNAKPYSQNGKDVVYVFKRIKPRVCLLCDRPNWAHDNSAKEIQKYLSNEFIIDIKYVVDHEELDINGYDAFHVLFWGETSYKNFKYSKSRIVKQVSSHRWQFDKPYGPMSVDAFSKEYLEDAATVICPSKILYDILKPSIKNLFLCGKGYAPELFRYIKPRSGELSLCMVGNLKDPVKGVEDILKPASKGYHLDIAQTIRHDELLHFYNEHDVYVVSSIHEADPLPLIESMACGCFPIATKIGIAPELIRHKENGYLVENRTIEDFRKAIDWCNNNILYIRNKAKQIAKEMFEKRRWEVMIANYRNMYRDHIGRR